MNGCWFVFKTFGIGKSLMSLGFNFGNVFLEKFEHFIEAYQLKRFEFTIDKIYKI